MGDWRYNCTIFSSVLDGGVWSASSSGRFSHGAKQYLLLTRLGRSQISLDAVEDRTTFLYRELNSEVQPVTRHYHVTVVFPTNLTLTELIIVFIASGLDSKVKVQLRNTTSTTRRSG
jgi:hypothetical protein